jgi:MFS family permease
MRDPYEVPPPEPGSARVGTFAALEGRNFRILWSGTWASYIPFFMSFSVNNVVAFQLAHVNRAFGWVSFAQGIAMLFLVPLGGAGADRWPKRRLLAASQLFGAAVFGTFALLLALESLTIPAMAIGTFVIGIAVSFLGPARQALAADLVESDLRGNAVALNQIPLTGSQLLGPALAGLCLNSAVGAVGAYALMSAFYAVSALSLVWLPKSRVRANAGDTDLFADLREGLRYVRSHRRLRLFVAFFVCVIISGFSYNGMLSGLVEHAFSRSAQSGLPPLAFTSALGGLAISFITARVAGGARVVPMFLTMPFVFAAGVLCLSFAPTYPAAVAAMTVVGIGFGGFQTLNSAVIVRNTEPAYFGRVFSLTMLAFAGTSVMGLPISALADAISERRTLAALAGAVVLIAAGIGAQLRRTTPP